MIWNAKANKVKVTSLFLFHYKKQIIWQKIIWIHKRWLQSFYALKSVHWHRLDSIKPQYSLKSHWVFANLWRNIDCTMLTYKHNGWDICCLGIVETEWPWKPCQWSNLTSANNALVISYRWAVYCKPLPPTKNKLEVCTVKPGE